MDTKSFLSSHLSAVFGIFRRPICAALLLSTAACSDLPTEGVSFAFDVQVERTDDSGKNWRATPDEILAIPRDPIAKSAFPDIQYTGKIFQWLVTADAKDSTAAGWIGSRISSQLAGPVCFRFDEARLSSNWRKKPTPMLVFGQVHLPSKIDRMNRTGEPPFQPIPLCFSPQDRSDFHIVTDISDLYPKRRMFNAKMESYRSLLPDNGVGNWLKIHVPIEYEGKRDEVEVTLTVKDSKKQSYRAVF